MNQTTCASNDKYVPPKDWTELSADEKIERMRDVVKNLSSSISQGQVSMYNLRRKLKNHEHTDAGKVIEEKEITEYDDESGGLCGTASLSASNYF